MGGIIQKGIFGGGGGAAVQNPTILSGASLLTGVIDPDYKNTWFPITDASFRITIDGNIKDVTGLNFSGNIGLFGKNAALPSIPSPSTPIATWNLVTDGGFKLTAGNEKFIFSSLRFDHLTSLDQIIFYINAQLSNTPIIFLSEDHSYIGANLRTWIFKYSIPGAHSLSIESPDSGTDLRGATYFSMASFPGTTGSDGVIGAINAASDGTWKVERVGTKLLFSTVGVGSNATIGYLEPVDPPTGTDVSGSTYLNGRSGTGIITPGTGF